MKDLLEYRLVTVVFMSSDLIYHPSSVVENFTLRMTNIENFFSTDGFFYTWVLGREKTATFVLKSVFPNGMIYYLLLEDAVCTKYNNAFDDISIQGKKLKNISVEYSRKLKINSLLKEL